MIRRGASAASLVLNTDLIQILKSVPALETLVISGEYLHNPYVDFFRAFVPVRAQEASGLHQSSWEGQIPGVLCPKLQSLQIEGINPTREPKLRPVLKAIVTSRTIVGSPLKSFTFYAHGYFKKWELIGKDGRFAIEEVVPAQEFVLAV